MRWVTRENVHLDRVASPWLILRFIDPAAEFIFIDPATRWPDDAISFAMPGAAIGMHDADGTTFDKLLARYKLIDPALTDIAAAVRAGVRMVLGEELGDAPDFAIPLGTALLALAEGVMVLHPADPDRVGASLGFYDALYAYLWGRHRDPRVGVATFWDRIAGLHAAWPEGPPGRPGPNVGAVRQPEQ